MIIGIVIGIAITCFLIVPGAKRVIQNNAKAEILEANNTISTKNNTITSLQKQVDDLTAQITDAKTSEESSNGKITSYEQLLAAYEAYGKNDVQAAGEALANVKQDDLSEEAKAIYDEMNTSLNAEYIQTLYTDGYNAYSSGKYADAIDALKKVTEMDESYENGNAIYYLAQSYRKNNDMESAKPYYEKVIELYPNTERANNAKNYLGQE